MEYYNPSSLTSHRIDTIFKHVVADKRSVSTVKCVLFQKENGFPENSRPIFFDTDALNMQKSKLEYLLGQLKDIHDKKAFTTPKTAILLYNNQIWVDDKTTLLKFLHLACAVDLLSPIDAKTSSLAFRGEFYPTISVTDPDFDKWQTVNKPKILERIEKENKG